MHVSEAELRELVREAIATARGERVMAGPPLAGTHPSHLILPLARGSDGDGACLIEPAVPCNHCGYCLSYGH